MAQLRGELTPAYYVPLAQAPPANAVALLRTRGQIQSAESAIARAVHKVDATVPVSDLRTLQQRVQGASARERTAAQLIGVFALLAVLLGAVGLYGVLSYAVAQRSRELSLRSALGAPRGVLLNMVLREGMALSALGLAVGLPAALLASRALQSMLYGVGLADPVNIALVMIVLLATSAAAAVIPALKALRADPANALRG